MPHLRLAYAEIAKQKQVEINIEKAARLESDLFISSFRNGPLEELYQILVNIYETVFKTQSKQFLKAAMLRAVLLQR